MSNPAQGKTLAAVIGVAATATVLAIVPRFEGMVLRGYKDPIGIVTACAGHTKTAVLGRSYTYDECIKLLDTDLIAHAEGIMKCIKVPTTSYQRAAYTSFAYNVGVSAFCGSTLLHKLNQLDYAGSCAEMGKWIYAPYPRVLPGLVTRRAAEQALCEGKVTQ